MDRVREEFEAWAKLNGLRLERQTSMCGGDMGRYDFGPTQAALEVWCDAWQASRAALCVKLPYSVDFCGDLFIPDGGVTNALDDAGVRYE